MSLTVKSRHLFFGGLCLLALLLNGCGDDSDASQESYEKALYMAYATSDSSETMNVITVSDLDNIVYELIAIVAANVSGGYTNIPSSVDLSDWDNVPSGMAGTITYSMSSALVTANLTLSSCIIGTRTYTGTFKANGYVDPASLESGDLLDLEFYSLTLTATNLTVLHTSTNDIDDVKFTHYVLGEDYSGSYPTYTFTGDLTYGNSGYGYDNYQVAQSSSSAKAVSGTLLFSGYYFGVSGSVTVDSSYLWTAGTLTITSQDSDGNVEETATVTLDGTTASFAIDGGDSWDMEDWYSDQLAP